jgi:hypothetical protein
MGIYYGKLDKKQTITPSEAHQRYLTIGGKCKSCRCQTAANLRAANAGNCINHAISTAIKGRKSCYVDCV